MFGRRALCLGILAVVLTGCAPAERRPVCQALDALRGAVTAMNTASQAVVASDQAEVARLVEEVERLLRVARGKLAGVGSDTGSGGAARALLEAANYLEYMTGQYRTSGRIDFSITQFAARELNRASAGAGGPPLNC